MKIIFSELFKKFPEVKFGFSTKIGLERKQPYYFNMSNSVGDNPSTVWENRKAFFSEIGIATENISFQKQVHSSIVKVVDKLEPSKLKESDAHITNVKGIGLVISSADCTPIFLFDSENKVIAGVHSGWKGTKERILSKTLQIMHECFHSSPEHIWAYIGPSISAENYEVGKEFDEYFSGKYLIPRGQKYLLDLKTANYDMLLEFGVPREQIEVSRLCSYEEEDLHSYRRDGIVSGRAFGVIALAN